MIVNSDYTSASDEILISLERLAIKIYDSFMSVQVWRLSGGKMFVVRYQDSE